jgi:hypothetical protein
MKESINFMEQLETRLLTDKSNALEKQAGRPQITRMLIALEL